MKAHKQIFWVLQTIGWGLPAILNTWATFIYNKHIPAAYVLFESSMFFLIGVLGTWVFRLKLKQLIDFKSLHKTNFLRLSLLFFGVANSIVLVLFAVTYIYYVFFGLPIEIGLINIFSSWINIHLFVIIWMVLYIAIKTIRQLRQARVERLVLKTELKESQLNTLKGQINPHFMFNNLNNIRGLMLEDVNKARDMITCLSEILRYSLNKDKIDEIILLDEIAMIDNYIALSKIQFEDRLSYKQDIDKSLLNSKIPPMIIQMLVENAVKHGIAHQALGGTVLLNIFQNDMDLIVQVINTGQLLVDSNSTQLGIDNIKNRLDLLYNGQASFSLVEDNNNVVATINIPLL